MRSLASFSFLVFGMTDALDTCNNDVLVKAYEGLNVSTQLVSCMTQHKFSAALDGSVDLAIEKAASAPDNIKALCTADSCKTILSALVGSANFNLTNCIVGNNTVLKEEVSKLQATCLAISPATETPNTNGAPTYAPADVPTAASTTPPTDAPAAPPTDTPQPPPTDAILASAIVAKNASATNATTAPAADAIKNNTIDAPPTPPIDASAPPPTGASAPPPTNAAAPPPTDGPTPPPTDGPTPPPTDGPTPPPTDGPTPPPTDGPTPPPTDGPTPPPSNAPTPPPIKTLTANTTQTLVDSSNDPSQLEPYSDEPQQMHQTSPSGKHCE
ncbi:putative elicitin [Plasmopara halstedii]